MFSRRLHPPGELPHSGQEAVGQRGEVVARVEDVGLAALAFLQPHEIRAGREERPLALTEELQDDAGDAEHHPHCDHDVVCVKRTERVLISLCLFFSVSAFTADSCELTDGLERHVGERCTEVVVEEAFEDVQGDVRQTGVDVGVDGQNHSVRSDNAACGDVSLI